MGLGWLSYGAREYDASIGRWMSVDPLAHVQEKISTYAYSLNNPTIYVDPDGSLPILINGRAACNNCRGNEKYWGRSILATIANSGVANPGGELHFVDRDQFYDNHAGYSFRPKEGKGWFHNGNHPGERRQAGYLQAEADFEEILSKLERDPETGKITEHIQIYTHSRGGAFGEGYTKALRRLIMKNSDLFQDASNVIDFSLNLGAHQSSSIDAIEGVPIYSMHHFDDALSGTKMGGTLANFASKIGNGTIEAHSTTSFVKEVNSFLNNFNQNRATQSTIDNFVRQMQEEYGITVTVRN